jgi:hypothetical protein
MKGQTFSGIALAAVLIICCNSEARAKWSNNSGKTEVQRALAAAKNPLNQKIATKVFCYCGCDRESGHKNLLDCYNTGHVPHCPTCAQEFNRVQAMNTQPLAEIQNRIDGEFAVRYPYHEQSEILKQYLSTKGQPYM